MGKIASDDYIEIANLMGRYGHIMEECSMSGGPWDRLGEIYSDDVVFGVEPDGVWMNGLGELKDTWGASTHPWGHHATNLVIESTGPDSATCASKVIIILPDARTVTGVYLDRLIRTPEGWRIQHRVCTMRPIDHDAPLPIPWPK